MVFHGEILRSNAKRLQAQQVRFQSSSVLVTCLHLNAPQEAGRNVAAEQVVANVAAIEEEYDDEEDDAQQEELEEIEEEAAAADPEPVSAAESHSELPAKTPHTYSYPWPNDRPLGAGVPAFISQRTYQRQSCCKMLDHRH